MGSTIYVPKKINVGYQKRKDTYTGQLAYIIYYDQNNRLRKEASWQSWRDKSIDNNEFDNESIEGFVLNKKVGGYDTGWSHRQTYSRIYDPRGFEFEITVENLLYILENANCIKGKGLEGKFVYGWDGKELLLLPEAAPEFSQYQEYSSLLGGSEAIKGKDLVLGGTYLTNKNEQVIYLGRFDLWERHWRTDKAENKGKRYYFYKPKGKDDPYYYREYQHRASLSKQIIKAIDTTPVANYADLMSKLEYRQEYSPYDPTKDKLVPATEKSVKSGKTSVGFVLEGTQLTGSISECGEGTGRYVFRDVSAVGEDGGGYSYSYGYRFPKRDAAQATLTLRGHYKSYSRTSEGIPLKELLDTYKPTYTRKFLANGKEIK